MAGSVEGTVSLYQVLPLTEHLFTRGRQLGSLFRIWWVAEAPCLPDRAKDGVLLLQESQVSLCAISLCSTVMVGCGLAPLLLMSCGTSVPAATLSRYCLERASALPLLRPRRYLLKSKATSRCLIPLKKLNTHHHQSTHKKPPLSNNMGFMSCRQRQNVAPDN